MSYVIAENVCLAVSVILMAQEYRSFRASRPLPSHSYQVNEIVDFLYACVIAFYIWLSVSLI